MLPDAPLLIAFAIAALAVILSPGPDTLYVLSRSVGEGRLSGIVASLGISAGLCVHIGAAALGLSQLFEYAPVAFDILRWTGVAYLLYLAWRAFTGETTPLNVSAGTERKRLRRAFSEAALTNLLNPKIIVFFIAQRRAGNASHKAMPPSDVPMIHRCQRQKRTLRFSQSPK